jgi:thiopurine S-methyltransferase
MAARRLTQAHVASALDEGRKADMQAEYWHEKWERNDVGFHQAAVHPGLAAHWQALGVASGARVLVPLCGKSLDMRWLADAGYAVLGVELSELACRAFFAEAGIVARERHDGRFLILEGGPYRLLCGDVFALTYTDLTEVRGVYDRAALVALPPDMRARYARLLVQRLPRTAPMLLVTFEYDQSRMPGPPHAVPFAEVQAHYSGAFDLQVLHDSGRAEAPPPMRARGLDWIAEQTIALRRTPASTGVA